MGTDGNGKTPAARFEGWQTERMYAVTTDTMEANGGLQRSNNKSLRPECLVEAAAREFEGFNNLKAGRRLCTRKGQAAMLEQQRLTARGLGGSCHEGLGGF